METSPPLIEHIIGGCGAGDDLFMLLTSYEETNALGATGQLLHGTTAFQHYESVITTNQPLSCVWLSPTGSLWLTSGNGHVLTTARIPLPPHEGKDVTFSTRHPQPAWRLGRLPDSRLGKLAPNITALWGTSDQDVHCGCFDGSVYHWNGQAWAQYVVPGGGAVNRLHGAAPNDVWLAGYQATVAHFDGTAWSRVPLPPEVGATDVVTGIRATRPGEAIACTRGGKILAGNTQGLRLVESFQAEFYGIGVLENTLYLAGGRSGIWQRTAAGFSVVKPQLVAVDVFETPGSLFFVEPEQPRPCVIQHRALEQGAWMRRKY